MIPPNLRELLTAAVDGELTPGERKAAVRLLRESAEARALFAQLQADAGRLKALLRVPAPADLAENVLATIRDRALTPTPLPPSPRGPRVNWPAVQVWVNVATAAAVLVMISVGSYLYFAAMSADKKNREQALAARQNLPHPVDHSTAAKPPAPERAPQPREVTPKSEPGPGAVVQGPRTPDPELGPSPRVVPSRIETGPFHLDPAPEIEPFDLDKIRVSQFFTLGELPTDEKLRKKLVAEMQKDELIRLDLFCQTTPRALDLVLAALKARGVTQFTDAFVQDRVKRKAATEVMIFTEAMTPDEVAQFLTALGADDRKAAPAEFSTLVAAPFLPADLDKLGRLLGVPAVQPKAPKGKPAVDIRKPLPEGTAKDVAAALSKMGSTPTPPAKAEKVAVAVAYSPANPHPAASKEIKQFLDRRGDRRPEAKPLMLVLRTVQ